MILDYAWILFLRKTTMDPDSNEEIKDQNEQVDEYDNRNDDLQKQDYVSGVNPPKATVDSDLEEAGVIREGLSEYAEDIKDRNSTEDLYNSDDDSSRSYPV